LIGTMPRTGAITEWEQWRFEVVDLDGNRIDKVLASPLAELQVEAEDSDKKDIS